VVYLLHYVFNSSTFNGQSPDLLLLESFVNFFGSGFVMNYKKRSVCEFIITKIDHIVEHIIPFFFFFSFTFVLPPSHIVLRGVWPNFLLLKIIKNTPAFAGWAKGSNKRKKN